MEGDGNGRGPKHGRGEQGKYKVKGGAAGEEREGAGRKGRELKRDVWEGNVTCKNSP